MKEINASEFESEVVKGGNVVLDFTVLNVHPAKRFFPNSNHWIRCLKVKLNSSKFSDRETANWPINWA